LVVETEDGAVHRLERVAHLLAATAERRGRRGKREP
jgi:hypothetical protein